MKEVLLFSGGPDALIAYEYLNHPDALYVRHDCKYEPKQIAAVEELKHLLNVDNIRLSPTMINLSLFEQEDSNIPLRNLYLIMYAANMGYDNINIVMQLGERSLSDRSEIFVIEAESLLSHTLQRPIIISPVFPHWTKQDMVSWYIESGHDVEILKETVSCFNPTVHNCGECKACLRRWIAFEYNNIHEDYTNDITKWTGTKECIRKMKNGEYDYRRAQQTLEVLKRHGLV